MSPDLPLADGEVLVVVDVHPLEGVAAAGVLVLDEEDDAEAALRDHLLEVDRLAPHRPRTAAQQHRVARARRRRHVGLHRRRRGRGVA